MNFESKILNMSFKPTIKKIILLFLIIAALLHLLSYFGINPEKYFNNITIFLIIVALILVYHNYKEIEINNSNENHFLKIYSNISRRLKYLFNFANIYFFVILFVSAYLSNGNIPNENDGIYFSKNIIKTDKIISERQYWELRNINFLFTSYGILYLAFLAFLYKNISNKSHISNKCQ